MKKVLKTIGLIFLGFVVIGVIFSIYDLGKQKEIKKLTIKDIDVTKLNDGKYSGEYSYYRWNSKVEVMVSNHKITDIKFTGEEVNNFPNIADKLTDEVIEKQSLKVDTISGATITTKTYLKSIENALTK
jgi:uncharacterized protein with FMN-binding domain